MASATASVRPNTTLSRIVPSKDRRVLGHQGSTRLRSDARATRRTSEAGDRDHALRPGRRAAERARATTTSRHRFVRRCTRSLPLLPRSLTSESTGSPGPQAKLTWSTAIGSSPSGKTTPCWSSGTTSGAAKNSHEPVTARSALRQGRGEPRERPNRTVDAGQVGQDHEQCAEREPPAQHGHRAEPQCVAGTESGWTTSATGETRAAIAIASIADRAATVAVRLEPVGFLVLPRERLDRADGSG